MLDVTTDTLSRVTYLFHKSATQRDWLLEMCPGAAAQIAPDERVSFDSVRRSNYCKRVNCIGNKYLQKMALILDQALALTRLNRLSQN